MADIRIKDLATTASSAASDDFMALDGATNGTRKMSAANPSVTTLTTSGVIAPGGSVHGANGSAANPSFAFLSNQNTGLYRIGTDNIGVAANGAKVLDIATTGLTVTGAVTVSSTTAGSSGAGALVVAGGLSAAGASYFGGQVTAARPFMSTGAITANMTSAGGFGFAGGGTNFYSFGANSATSGSFAFQSISSDASVNFNALTLAAGTGAATFAGTISPQQATTAAAPSYVKGAIYFDTTLNKLRVGGATAWETITSV